MDTKIELQRVIHDLLMTQIDFGIYRYGERLPSMDESSRLLFVSFDTIRAVYKQLKLEGRITLSRSTGAIVNVRYEETDIESNIRNFFLMRKDAIMDLCCSMHPLFSNAQLMGFKNASAEVLERSRELALQKNFLPSYMVIHHLHYIYGSFNNETLQRLAWQAIMFFPFPFLSITRNVEVLEKKRSPFLDMIDFCHEKAWGALSMEIELFHERYISAVNNFFAQWNSDAVPDTQIAFTWSSYKKSSQICYSLAMDLMTSINRKEYADGDFLPSLENLAKEKKVSVSTVRRTLSLLNSIGFTKTVNGRGTKILSDHEIAANCNLADSSVRRRLLEYAQCFQLIALSCRKVSKITIDSLDEASMMQFMEHLLSWKRLERPDLSAYTILDFITRLAPYETLRTVYKELFQQLIWGYPLCGLTRADEKPDRKHHWKLDYFIGCLERRDSEEFSAKLEEFIQFDFEFTLTKLDELGLDEAACLSLCNISCGG